jgi:hypothetical protein
LVSGVKLKWLLRRVWLEWRESAMTSTPDMPLHRTKRRFGPLTSDLRLDAPQQSWLRYSMRPAAARDMTEIDRTGEHA